jgi:hypothetical protein
MSDGRCGASAVALWLRGHRPFATRSEHDAACTKVINDLKNSVREGKPNDESPTYLDSIPGWNEREIEQEVLGLTSTSWWNDFMWPVVALFYNCTVKLFMLGDDANGTIEVTSLFFLYFFFLPVILSCSFFVCC